MKRLSCLPIGVVFLVAATSSKTIPRELWGTWTVRRELPTTTIACWGEDDAKTVIGSKIKYSAEILRWKNIRVKHPVAETTTVTAEQWAQDNSAMDANGSQVDFRQLGIEAKQALQVQVLHPDAAITVGDNEIPGDEVLIKDHNTIIFSVCNIYFEATRVTSPKGAGKKASKR